MLIELKKTELMRHFVVVQFHRAHKKQQKAIFSNKDLRICAYIV